MTSYFSYLVHLVQTSGLLDIGQSDKVCYLDPAGPVKVKSRRLKQLTEEMRPKKTYY